MSTRDIQGHLDEIYAVQVSPLLISDVTEMVMEDVRAWRAGRSIRCTRLCIWMR